MTLSSAIEKADTLLSKRELAVYNIWRGTEQPVLAPSLNVKLFSLWLAGKDCEEIRRLNPALSLGQIIHARLTGDWDRRREEHIDKLLTETSTRVQQTTLEAATFVCDLIAVANREHGDRLRRYLQTGDEKELGDFRVSGLQGLKLAIEMLQKLTGQERKTTISGEVIHRAETNLPVNREPTSQEAGIVLRLLLGGDK